MNSCPSCGVENPESAVDCARCGTALVDPAVRAMIGTVVLGAYEIVAPLGRGGMSLVFGARHRLTDQRVALKILPPELALHRDLKARFLEEAKALARLEHPGIVRLYNFGEEAGRFVLVMQFAEGENWETRILEKGKVEWREAARIGVQVLDALEYAHGRGIVHRDIKPSNIIVTPEGKAMVMDFGIAKVTYGSSRLTATGQTMGTVRYMSPEQVRGQAVDHRSDIYSFGVTLFEALAGDTPFDGNTHFEIMSKHLSEPVPSLLGLGVALPEALDRIVARSMAKDPAERFQSAAEFRQSLEQVLSAEAGTTASADPAQAKPHALFISGEAHPGERGHVTGLASALEPAPSPPTNDGRRVRVTLWGAMGAVVIAASVAVLAFARRDAASDSASTQPSGPEGSWPAPLLVAGVKFETDQTFGPPELVRILATRKLDAAHLARTYATARARFVDYVNRQNTGAAVEIKPLNVVIVPSTVMCDPRLYEPKPAPEGCEKTRFLYPEFFTLYLPDDENLDLVNLPEGTALHLCMSTSALQNGGWCKRLLPPYFDEVERNLEGE